MQITQRQVNDVTILDLQGKLVIGSGDTDLRNAASQALDNGNRAILLNMANVTTIDSTGVGELVSSYARATSQGAKLKLCNLSAKVSDILIITQLITVFEVYDSENEAIESFS